MNNYIRFNKLIDYKKALIAKLLYEQFKLDLKKFDDKKISYFIGTKKKSDLDNKITIKYQIELDENEYNTENKDEKDLKKKKLIQLFIIGYIN